MPRAVFAAALVLFGFTLWPILVADAYYIDDLGRSLHGYLGWGRDARPLANVVMELLNLGTPLVDLSPLPQLGAILLFAGLAVSLARRFALAGAWPAPLAVMPMVASPFFLENLSYKFDALTMSLAVCLAAWSALGSVATRWRAVAGGAGLFGALCLYQPAAAVFIIFAVLSVSVKQMEDGPLRTVLREAGVRAIQCCGAVGIYAVTVARTAKGAYAAQHAAVETSPEIGRLIAANLRAFLHFDIVSLFSAGAGPLAVLIVIGLVALAGVGMRYAARHWRAGAGRQRTALIAGALAPPVTALCGVWGPMLLLQNPVLVPRTQVGVGALGTASAIMLLIALGRLRVKPGWQVALLAVWAYPLMAFAMVYGNTLKLQAQYEGRLAGALAEDIAAVHAQGRVDRWALQGTAGMPPVASHNARKFPFLHRLVPIHLTQGWGWATDRLAHAGLTLARAPADAVDIGSIRECTSRPVTSRPAYRLYVVDRTAVVVFNDANLPDCGR